MFYSILFALSLFLYKLNICKYCRNTCSFQKRLSYILYTQHISKTQKHYISNLVFRHIQIGTLYIQIGENVELNVVLF